MTPSDKLRKIVRIRFLELFERNPSREEAKWIKNIASDLTALISEGYVSKEEHEAEIKRLLHCGSCGEPLSRDCPKCQHLWQT